MGSLRVLALLLMLMFAPIFGMAAEPRGTAERIPWTTSRLMGSPEPPTPYKVTRAFPKLSPKQPLAMFPEPSTDRLLILHHLGSWSGPTRLLAVKDRQDADRIEQLIELGGLSVGFALHPNYQKNGYIYFGVNGPIDGVKMTHVLRYTVSRAEPYGIDVGSKQLVIAWKSDGHDGGDVVFGADGYLYVTSGDGSSGSDGHNTGQRIDDLLGSVMRIDVDHPEPGKNYSIPKDNPFVNRPGARPELWAYGLRNPWRISFDRESGQLWVGQNGQDLWEQVYLIQKGGNYGWSLTEGSHIFEAKRQAGPDPILPPTAEHPHSEARSLSGGRVYRGKKLPDLVGVYIYGDWSTGRVWGIKHDGNSVIWHRELVDTPFNITGFGVDHAGEIYVIDHQSGFYRFEPNTTTDRRALRFPSKLSETGLFESAAKHSLTPAAIRYDVVAPQWADGATIERFVAIPGKERILQQPQLNAGGAWTMPNGTALAQTLSLNVVDDSGKTARKRIETRILLRQQGEWAGYSYRWNSAQTDGELVPALGSSAVFEVPDSSEPGGRKEQDWRFPSRTECMVCHSRAAGFMAGFTPLQLDRNHKFGARTLNQLRAYEQLGLFEGKLPEPASDRPQLVNPYDSRGSLEARVKTYLHVNCSTCHVHEGGGNAPMEMVFTTPLDQMKLINATPLHDRFNIADPKIVAPGSTARSVLYQRISRRGTGQMPPLVSTQVDTQAVKLIGDWIRGLERLK
jgi:glucose/arabinose dehydrogenase